MTFSSSLESANMSPEARRMTRRSTPRSNVLVGSELSPSGSSSARGEADPSYSTEDEAGSRSRDFHNNRTRGRHVSRLCKKCLFPELRRSDVRDYSNRYQRLDGRNPRSHVVPGDLLPHAGQIPARGAAQIEPLRQVGWKTPHAAKWSREDSASTNKYLAQPSID